MTLILVYATDKCRRIFYNQCDGRLSLIHPSVIIYLL